MRCLLLDKPYIQQAVRDVPAGGASGRCCGFCHHRVQGSNGTIPEDRALIPEGNLAEVKYEDLVSDPLGEMERNLRGTRIVRLGKRRKAGGSRVPEHAPRTTKRIHLSRIPAAMERVSREWRFAFEEWNYELPVKRKTDPTDVPSRLLEELR